MPDPTPEERAEALERATMALEAQEEADRLSYGYAWEHLGDAWRDFAPVARALLAAESERAKLAREVERLKELDTGLADHWRESLERSEREVERLVEALDGMARAPYGEFKAMHDRAERAEREVEELRATVRAYTGDGPVEMLKSMDEGDPIVGLMADPKWVALVRIAALSEPTEGK